MAVKIEPNIPLPPRHPISYYRMGMSKLKVGDSFLIEYRPNHLYRAAGKLKIQIATRKINGEGYRIWRTA